MDEPTIILNFKLARHIKIYRTDENPFLYDIIKIRGVYLWKKIDLEE